MGAWSALRPTETRRGEPLGEFPVPMPDVAEMAVASPKDRVLETLAETALRHLERYTGRWLRRREITCIYNVPHGRPGISAPWRVMPAGDGWGLLTVSERVLIVPGSPVAKVLSVETRVAEEAEELYETVPDTSYRIEYGDDGREAEIVAVQGALWPMPVTRTAAYRVEARVGHRYGELPSELATATALLASYLYERRGCDLGEALQNSGAAGFASSYRMRRLV